jgi:ubiquinone/menaquinone biosynthesis C-methylase UbiE
VTADEAALAQAERVLAAADLRSGDTVLDLGTGLGLLSFGAHERIGEGWVIAVDPSVGALDELLERAHELGASGISYLVGDAAVLPLPDESVDVVLMRSVLARADDVHAVVDELARVLRPGGRVSLCEPPDGPDVEAAFAGWSEVRVEAEGELYLSARRA